MTLFVPEGHALEGLDPRLKKVESELIAMIRQAPTQLLVRGFTGEMSGIPLQGRGHFLLDQSQMAMTLGSQSFDLAHLREVFPGIRSWKLSGDGQTRLVVRGNMSNPLVKGELWSSQTHFYGFHPEDLWFQYRFQDQALTFELMDASLYQGHLAMNGWLNFKSPIPQLSVELQGQDMQASGAFPRVSQKRLSGHFNPHFRLVGNVQDYWVQGVLNPSELVFYRQDVSSVNVLARVLGMKDISVEGVDFFINQGEVPLHVQGDVKDLTTVSFSYLGDDILLKDLIRHGPHEEVGENPDFGIYPCNKLM